MKLSLNATFVTSRTLRRVAFHYMRGEHMENQLHSKLLLLWNLRQFNQQMSLKQLLFFSNFSARSTLPLRFNITILIQLHLYCINISLPKHHHYITFITITSPLHYHFIKLHYHHIKLHYHYITITFPLYYHYGSVLALKQNLLKNHN